MASARHVATEFFAGHTYVQLVRNATSETFMIFQEEALRSLAPFDSGVLEISLDETELMIDVHRRGGCGVKVGWAVSRKTASEG